MSYASTSTIGVARQPKRPTSSRNGEKPAIWIPMLQNSSKGKDLTEKQLIILGGSPEQQRDFLEQLNPPQDTTRLRYNQVRRTRTAPVSNKYAMGFTYHDILDADQEDVLARMNVYMLSSSSGAFAALLKPLLSKRYVKDTLITILLDWSEPWKWARQLRQWVRLLRKVILTLDDETKIEMEENMNAWKERKTGPEAQKQSEEQRNSVPVNTPLGPGEWDEGLGFPLSVICVQSEHIERLEREQGWQEDHFDFLLQWLRTVLLKHGASLCYVASFDANDVRTLLHSSLSIQSLLKKEVIKHNVIDRDKILVPPNWDSWGKIRILRDAFEAETVAERWSLDIQASPDKLLDPKRRDEDPDSAVALYEQNIPKPPADQIVSKEPPKVTITVPSLQEFLQEQKTELDRLAAKDDELPTAGRTTATNRDNTETQRPGMARLQSRAESYHVNVNGIDVDAEEATRRLREREEERKTSKRDSTPVGQRKVNVGDASTEDFKSFFAGLMNKKGGGKGSNSASGVASPRRESPAPERRIAADHT